jgi:hypothetical protein
MTPRPRPILTAILAAVVLAAVTACGPTHTTRTAPTSGT